MKSWKLCRITLRVSENEGNPLWRKMLAVLCVYWIGFVLTIVSCVPAYLCVLYWFCVVWFSRSLVISFWFTVWSFVVLFCCCVSQTCYFLIRYYAYLLSTCSPCVSNVHIAFIISTLYPIFFFMVKYISCKLFLNMFVFIKFLWPSVFLCFRDMGELFAF